MSDNVSISVDVNGFNLDVTIEQQATIYQLVRSMQASFFLDGNLDPNNLNYSDTEGKKITVNDNISVIAKVDNNIKLIVQYQVQNTNEQEQVEFFECFEKTMDSINFGDLNDARQKITKCNLNQIKKQKLQSLVRLIQIRTQNETNCQNQVKLYSDGLEKILDKNKSFNPNNYNTSNQNKMKITRLISQFSEIQQQSNQASLKSSIIIDDSKKQLEKYKKQTQDKINKLRKEQKKLQKSIQQLKQKNNSMKDQIKDKNQALARALENQRDQQSKIVSISKINNSSLTNEINNTNKVDKIIEILKKGVKKDVSHLDSLIRITNNKVSHHLHEFIDNQENLLLLALTQENRIIGGFSSQALNIKMKPGYGILFAFSSQKDIDVFPIRENCKAMQYDMDYLIFGCQELCIPLNEMKISSTMQNYEKNHFMRCYGGNTQARKKYFISLEQKKSCIQLQNYELFRVVFKN